MRIALPESRCGINDNGDEMDIKNIEEKVTVFRKWLASDTWKGFSGGKNAENVEIILNKCPNLAERFA